MKRSKISNEIKNIDERIKSEINNYWNNYIISEGYNRLQFYAYLNELPIDLKNYLEENVCDITNATICVSAKVQA